ncbi:23S rRNA (pseudouridine(1915)-N(3))-methyltransferase RlmH [Verrucomicrobium sp. BvORR034]|jgi:23S rRNA (pseudouridine1915-N3)-methyltransferase|uniref:23S rRNA (pseudouridine(1915)-N(3))-methyltransferase RlmH n=1 Tax=Verrucomicrobium sp. BvORR034 TaxID=1396418 RepID=UPI0006785070|nr:23S rRNA (pseudouridine(1915)-N(3))-methyltransferase RlmH [Verrucomicrobium sp. BvORR034]
MKWQIISVGKPALPWAKAGVEDYSKRLRRMAQVDMVTLKEGTPEQVGDRALEAAKDSWCIVLDEKGRHLTSMELAKWIEKQELTGRKRVSFLIGGADGHSPKVKAAANELWCLSAMTLQHEVALVLLLEQIYRGYSILRGDPYHRE